MNIFDITEELRNIFNIIEENEGELTPDIEARLSLSEEDFDDKIDAYSLYIKKVKGEAKVLKDEAKRFTAKAKALENRIDYLKDTVKGAIIAKEGRTVDYKVKYKTHLTTVWTVWNYSLLLDEEFNNKDYITEVVTEKINNAEIKKALLAGEVIENAELVSKESLTIK